MQSTAAWRGWAAAGSQPTRLRHHTWHCCALRWAEFGMRHAVSMLGCMLRGVCSAGCWHSVMGQCMVACL